MSQPVVIIPQPWCESLEVCHQGIAMWEWANELTEAWLKVDCDMVHAMCKLANAMSHVCVGGPVGLANSGQAVEDSEGVGWLGEGRGASKGKGKGQAVEGGEGGRVV